MSTKAAQDGLEIWNRKMTVGRFFAAALLPIILILGAAWFYSTHPLPRFSITFVAADTERIFSSISPYGRGLEQEMAKLFADRYDLELHWIKTDTPQEAWQALIDGRAQVMVGAGWRPKHIPDHAHISPGPVYERHKPVLLTSLRRPLDMIRPRIKGWTVAVQPQPALLGSLKAFGWQQGCRAEYSWLPDMRLQEFLAAENKFSTLPYFLVEAADFKLYQPFFHRIRPAAFLPETIGYRWYWRDDEHMLDKRMKAFFKRITLSGQLADLQERYQGFFPEDEEYGKVWLLKDAVRTKLPSYQDTILAAAERFKLDPLLVVAIIFQESAFNQDATSNTGVRGLMQLTQQTANILGATDRTDPDQSIWYGTKHLKRIWEKLAPLELDHWDRWAMTIASYNQGIGHIFDAMLLARSLGNDPRKWRNVKAALSKLTQEKYYSKAMYGVTRGNEGVDYVNRVRFYYYVLKGWASLPGLELDELAAFRLSLVDLGI